MPPGGLYAAGVIGESETRSAGGEDLVEPDLLRAALEQAASEEGPEPPLEDRDRLVLAVLPPAGAYGRETPIGEGAIWEVEYVVDDDPETEERGLVRRVTRVRDPAEGSEEEPPEQLAEEVVAMDVTYFDGSSGEWAETWDSGASETLPQAVAIDLVVRLGEEIILYRILVAPPTCRLSELNRAAGGGQGGGEGGGGGR